LYRGSVKIVSVQRAAELLRSGGLVAFPTETVYGLGANALDPAAVGRIFAAKGRPPTNPLIVHVADVAAARALVRVWPPAAQRLADAFWPGPLTLVLPKQPQVPDIVTAGLDAVGVRVPSHPLAQELLRSTGVPIAAPSANRSTELSPTRPEHVARSLGSAPDGIVDGGPTALGLESAVIDLTGAEPRLLRPGSLDLDRLREVCGPLRWEGNVIAREGEAQLAPGMMERHYAPRAQLVLVDAGDPAAVQDMEKESQAQRARGRKVGCLGFGVLQLKADWTHEFDPQDPETVGRELYARLHELDERGADVIYMERPPAGNRWLAIRDRLQRASVKG
jgi:L-threonylcarbamoyladenylate synthase